MQLNFIVFKNLVSNAWSNLFLQLLECNSCFVFITRLTRLFTSVWANLRNISNSLLIATCLIVHIVDDRCTSIRLDIYSESASLLILLSLCISYTWWLHASSINGSVRDGTSVDLTRLGIWFTEFVMFLAHVHTLSGIAIWTYLWISETFVGDVLIIFESSECNFCSHCKL